MPELPEVETVRRGVAAALRGARLRASELRRGDLRLPVRSEDLARLVGLRLLDLERRGKALALHFGRQRPSRSLLVHLGMSGRLFVDRSPEPAWERHEHWRGLFAGTGQERLWLRFVDVRRFGALAVVRPGEVAVHPLFAGLGPEPLGPDFSGEHVWQRTRGRRTPIKVWLLDGREVAGIGNIYACEACHLAGLHPERLAGSLAQAECLSLAEAVRSVLREAIAAGGTTIRDYVSGDGSPGLFQLCLQVYGREGEGCLRCGARAGQGSRVAEPGPRVCRAVVAGRSTFYCPACQV